MTIGITAGAEDAKYHAKYKELKRKVKDIEESNEKLVYKVEQAKQSIRRMKMERAILYERLNGPPPAVHDRPPPPHSHQHGGHHPQQHPGHPNHSNQNMSSLSRQSSHMHDNDVSMQDAHPRSSRQGGPPPHSASSMNDLNHTFNIASSQIPPPSSIRSPRRIGSSSGAASSGDPNRHHAGPPIPGQQPHAGAPLPPPGSAGSGAMPYDGPPGPPPRSGFNSHSTNSPAMHHAHTSSSHHSRTRSHSSSHSRPHMGTTQSQHQPPPPPPGQSHRGGAAVPPPPNYPESMYGPSPNAPPPLHSPPLSERDLRGDREREPHRDRDRTRDRDGVRERDREDREWERDREGRSRRAPSGAGSETYHPGYDYNSPPHMLGDAHLSPYERAGPLPAPSGTNRDPPMMHMSSSPRGAHAHPTRIHAHQRVGPGALIQQRDDLHERRGGDVEWEREREQQHRDRERRERDREREKREDKDYPRSSSYQLSPHQTHRPHRERDREYDAPHHLRDHSNYYPDSAYGPSDRGPPSGPSYPPPLHAHRSETPNSGSGADRDAPSRPDSRTGYYPRDSGHSHAPVTTSPRPAHIGQGGGRTAFRARPPHDDSEFAHGGREERERLAGPRASANGASSVSPAPPPGGSGPGLPPTNSASGSGTSTPLTGGQRPPKRSRTDMDMDSEPENGVGADGRGSGAATPRDGERNSKRYHRDPRRDIDEPTASSQ